jgi:hypothetical protein
MKWIFKSVSYSFVNFLTSFPLYVYAINLILWVLGFLLGVTFCVGIMIWMLFYQLISVSFAAAVQGKCAVSLIVSWYLRACVQLADRNGGLWLFSTFIVFSVYYKVKKMDCILGFILSGLFHRWLCFTELVLGLFYMWDIFSSPWLGSWM